MKQNPFDIPGFSTQQDNPLLASLNMMQQIWGNMAKSPLDLSPSSAVPTVEELSKRIEELQAVENWLRLNLSMLSSTIQGLEIQRSTLVAVQSMTQSGLETMADLSETMAKATPDPAADTAPSSEETVDDSLRQAGQAWWDLLQNQFDTIASATAQSMQQAQHAAENLSEGIGMPSADSTFQSQAPQTKPSAAKKATKSAAKKTSAAKIAKKVAKKTAKKAAAKKTS